MTTLVEALRSFARYVNAGASSAPATAIAFGLVMLWVVTGPRFHYSESWQIFMNTISAVTTFLMVFVLNHAQNRDTAAINAKLDSMIFAMHGADNRLIGLEDQSESEAKAVVKDLKLAVDEAQNAPERSV